MQLINAVHAPKRNISNKIFNYSSQKKTGRNKTIESIFSNQKFEYYSESCFHSLCLCEKFRRAMARETTEKLWGPLFVTFRFRQPYLPLKAKKITVNFQDKTRRLTKLIRH